MSFESKKRHANVNTTAMPCDQAATPAKVDSAISVSEDSVAEIHDPHLNAKITLSLRQLRDIIDSAIAGHVKSLRKTIRDESQRLAQKIDKLERAMAAISQKQFQEEQSSFADPGDASPTEDLPIVSNYIDMEALAEQKSQTPDLESLACIWDIRDQIDTPILKPTSAITEGEPLASCKPRQQEDSLIYASYTFDAQNTVIHEPGCSTVTWADNLVSQSFSYSDEDSQSLTCSDKDNDEDAGKLYL
ncbi:hypothetical protein HDU96_007336 [Phlyctochytrium bullatum]|nr:hypothetical protein HDU96_007336 [Phlyctochytrium bullatum]